MLINALIHTLVVLLLSPLLIGIIIRVKSRFAGRRGAPLVQPWRDIWRLLRKDLVISHTTSWVFFVGPVLGVVVPVLAFLFVPLGAFPAAISFEGDFILWLYLFALARFATAAAALDTGSSFEGMGAAREVTYASLAEPVLFFCLLVIARLSGSLSFNGMFGADIAAMWPTAGVSLLLVALCWMLVLLLENARIPFDDPTTHLELTMIHEVMVLDHSGPLLGLVHWGAAMKLMVSGALLVRVILPFSTGHPGFDIALFALGMILLAALIGVVESVMARFKLPRIPQIMVGAILFAFFAWILVLR